MPRLKGVGIGAGYFSQFHYDAWSRIPEVEIVAVCDLDLDRATAVCARHGFPRRYPDFRAMFAAEKPDFADVISPPPTHLEVCRAAARERFSLARTIERYFALYRKLADGARAAHASGLADRRSGGIHARPGH